MKKYIRSFTTTHFNMLRVDDILILFIVLGTRRRIHLPQFNVHKL